MKLIYLVNCTRSALLHTELDLIFSLKSTAYLADKFFVFRQANEHGMWNLQYENGVLHVSIMYNGRYLEEFRSCDAELTVLNDRESEKIKRAKVNWVPNNTLRACFNNLQIDGGGSDKPSIRISFKVRQYCHEILPILRNCITSVDQIAMDFTTSLQDGSGDIKLEADNGEAISAHTQVLRIRCLFFKKILTSKNKLNGVLRLKGLDKATIHDLLEYLYTGKVTNIAVKAERLLLVACRRFELDALKVLCENSLANQYKPDETKPGLRNLALATNSEYLQSYFGRPK